MAEQKAWVRKYVRETGEKARKQILDEAIEAEGLSPENELRKKLFEARYLHRNDQLVDTFIRGWMSFYYLQNTSHSLFRKKRVEKDLASIRSDWKLALCEEYGEVGRQVLYEELCNMMLVYFGLCHSDRTYSAVLLGMGRMKDDSLIGKISKDVYTLAYQLPKETGTEEEFAVFTRAATDMFCEKYDAQKGYLLDKIR